MYSRIFAPAVIGEQQKFFHTCSHLLRRTHYDVLKLTPKATAQDVKQAYYKLSKEYHPDRNKDNPEAVAKFREISESYEVLGNYKLRKLYDKGILHTAGHQYAQQAATQKAAEEEDDPTTRFYRMREKRTVAPQAPGETVYDFDEWTKQHYGKNFDRKQKEKRTNEYQMRRRESNITSLKVDKLMGVIMFIGFCLMIAPFGNHDVPKPIAKKPDDGK